MTVDQPRFALPTTASTLRVIAIVCAFVLLIWTLSDVLLLIFAAVLVAVMLRGSSDWLARRTGLAEGLTLAIVTISSVLLLGGLLYYLGPRLVNQGQQLWSHLSNQVQQLKQTYGNTPWGHLLFHQMSPSGKIDTRIANSTEMVVTSTADYLITTFVLAITAIYLAISPKLYTSGFVRLFPVPYRPRAGEILRHLGKTLSWWMLGQCIDMSVVAVMSAVGLTLLGTPLSLALGLLAGLLTFIPYFGAIAAAVPAVMVSLTISWHMALWVVVIFLCCHGVEGYVIAPLVQRRTVHLPPALTILSMMVLGSVTGPLGVILGTPFAAVLLVAVQDIYVGDVLGDPAFESSQSVQAVNGQSGRG